MSFVLSNVYGRASSVVISFGPWYFWPEEPYDPLSA